MYMEDDDICYRIHQAGKLVGIYSKARIVHLQGRSITHTRERKDMYYRSQTLFWQKHYGMLPAALMQASRMVYLGIQRTFQLGK